jgi:hypothetical protein
VRVRLALLCVGALAFPLAAGASAPLVVFHATTHTPKVNVHWPWSIVVTSGGKPVAGTVTAQVTCPVCGVHAVEFGGIKNKFVTNIKFVGRFHDFVIFPPISRGVRVTFRLTVKTALGKRVVDYWIQAK